MSYVACLWWLTAFVVLPHLLIRTQLIITWDTIESRFGLICFCGPLVSLSTFCALSIEHRRGMIRFCGRATRMTTRGQRAASVVMTSDWSAEIMRMHLQWLSNHRHNNDGPSSSPASECTENSQMLQSGLARQEWESWSLCCWGNCKWILNLHEDIFIISSGVAFSPTFQQRNSPGLT